MRPQQSNQGDYRSIPIEECGEPLFSLSGLSPRIIIYPYYFHQNIPHAENECYLRKGAAARLLYAASRLPDGIHMVVLDAWRPYEVQLALYNMILGDLRKQYTEEKAQSELAKFVAQPSQDLDRPSPHMTGGAIDLTLANEQGWLEMGTGFDEFTEKANTDYFEHLMDMDLQKQKIRNHRRLLQQVMNEAGFTNYEEEWWHFDYGNQRWAMNTGQRPIYRGVRKSDKNS